jgi:hypothetical protein
LSDSIEAAEAALKDLRSEMSRGSRELLKDLDKTLRDARPHAPADRQGPRGGPVGRAGQANDHGAEGKLKPRDHAAASGGSDW